MDAALREGLAGLREQAVESERYRDLSNSSEFGVVKRMRDNDVALHENQARRYCSALSSKSDFLRLKIALFKETKFSARLRLIMSALCSSGKPYVWSIN